MQTFAETIEIAATPERVWRALTIPTEVVCWDTGVLEPIDAPSDYPRPGQHVRWRYRFGLLPLTLHDRPTQVEPPRFYAPPSGWAHSILMKLIRSVPLGRWRHSSRPSCRWRVRFPSLAN